MATVVGQNISTSSHHISRVRCRPQYQLQVLRYFLRLMAPREAHWLKLRACHMSQCLSSCGPCQVLRESCFSSAMECFDLWRVFSHMSTTFTPVRGKNGMKALRRGNTRKCSPKKVSYCPSNETMAQKRENYTCKTPRAVRVVKKTDMGKAIQNMASRSWPSDTDC